MEHFLGTDKKPVYKAGTYTSKEAFDQWFNTDTRPLNQAQGTPVNLEVPIDIELTYTAEGWFYSSATETPVGFWALDNKGFQAGSSSSFHNFHFTMECHMRFGYRGGEIFKFNGDDDVWVYIDNQLVVDIGGLHPPEGGQIALDTLSLQLEKSYDMSIFFAERHADGSNFILTSSLESPPIRKLCLRASTVFPKNNFQAMVAMTKFPANHAYMTRTTCGGNTNGKNDIPSSGPAFSGCGSVTSGELVYALDNLLKSSVSPIAKEKEVLIASVIDDSGDIYFVLQGGPMPSGTNNYFVMDVGVDVGTSGSNTQGTLAMLHSPGIGGSTRSTWDASKINGEYQRLTLVWSGPQTAGLVLGPFKGVGTCLKLKVTESGKVDKFAVGSQNGLVVTDLSINPLAMEQGGLVVCSHGCDDACTTPALNDCNTCIGTDNCGWAVGRGCFELDSGITNVNGQLVCPEKQDPDDQSGGTGGTGGAGGAGSGDGSGEGGGGDVPASPSSVMDAPGGGLEASAVAAILLLLMVCCCCIAAGAYYYFNYHRTKKGNQNRQGKKSTKNKHTNKQIEMSSSSSSGSSSGLPPGWTQFVDEGSGYPCYVNDVTGATQWELPVVTEMTNPMGRSSSSHSSHERSETVLPPGWGKDKDGNNMKFYYGPTGEVSWDAPPGSTGGSSGVDAADAAGSDCLPDGWGTDYDADGTQYWYGPNEETSWHPPEKKGW